MNHLSLFNGIGGFQLAASWLGWNNVAHVEIDEFCNKVVAKHFPDSQCFTDIKLFDGKLFTNRIDVLSGGPPCQPASVAGKRKGKGDDRWLWPEAIRALREIKPRYAVFENPGGILSLGNGNPFHEILSALENEGYKVEPIILPACSVQAVHERSRIWIIAYANSIGCSGWNYFAKGQQYDGRRNSRSKPSPFSILPIITNSNKQGLSKRFQTGFRSIYNQAGESERGEPTRTYPKTDWSEFPTQSPICRGNDGIPNRVDRLISLGNAIVPQVVFEIFKAIEQYNSVLH
jgi:DNA (cytosine-5)-methyltransferase 1